MKTYILAISKIILFSTLLFSMESCDTMCRGVGGVFPSQCKKDEPAQGNPEPEAAVVTDPQQPGHSPVAPKRKTEEVISYKEGEGFPLILMTPEQLSNHVKLALSYGSLFFYEPTIGRDLDYLQVLYGVSLGGIDFVSTSKRDRSIKAQTLLVARALAWSLARDAVFTDIFTRPSNSLPKQLLIHVDHDNDRPFEDSDLNLSADEQALVRAGEVNWTKQVEELFWRFYSRPPNAVEIQAIKEAFITSRANEPELGGAWAMVIYALLSSQEFWNL